tara:strand:+ start:1034 stop:1432 length:399 start_codon:yes stop_codon:yes gene_type:complete
MKQKYLYFRTQATDGNDDARGDSALFPALSLMGMQPTGDSELTLYFKPMMRRFPSGNEPDADASFDNHDSVALTLSSANTHLAAMRAITNVINNDNFALITIANDDSGGTEYLSGSGISACGTITVQDSYAN